MENSVLHPYHILKNIPMHCFFIFLHFLTDMLPFFFPSLKWASLPYPTQKGQVGGHEGVGVIVKMGPATERAVVKVGQRVGIKWVAGICGSCPPCLEGYDGFCRSAKVSGYYTLSPHFPFIRGGERRRRKNCLFEKFIEANGGD